MSQPQPGTAPPRQNDQQSAAVETFSTPENKHESLQEGQLVLGGSWALIGDVINAPNKDVPTAIQLTTPSIAAHETPKQINGPLERGFAFRGLV